MAALVTTGGLASYEYQQVHNSAELENPQSLEAGFQRVLRSNHVPFLGLPRLPPLPRCPLTRQQCPCVCKERR